MAVVTHYSLLHGNRTSFIGSATPSRPPPGTKSEIAHLEHSRHRRRHPHNRVQLWQTRVARNVRLVDDCTSSNVQRMNLTANKLANGAFHIGAHDRSSL